MNSPKVVLGVWSGPEAAPLLYWMLTLLAAPQSQAAVRHAAAEPADAAAAAAQLQRCRCAGFSRSAPT